MRPRLLIINAGKSGLSGQSGAISKLIQEEHQNSWEMEELVLQSVSDVDIWRAKINRADAFFFLTGTYWDSWSSYLQNFLEETTSWETSELWLGKPAAVVVTMHSVGGKGVLSRLQGVLNTLGLVLPPLGGMVYSLNSHLAKESSSSPMISDFWGLEDIKVIMNNLLMVTTMLEPRRGDWAIWDVDRTHFDRPWL